MHQLWTEVTRSETNSSLDFMNPSTATCPTSPQADEALMHAQRAMRVCKDAYESSVDLRSSRQRDLSSMLQRKPSWTAAGMHSWAIELMEDCKWKVCEGD